MTKLFLDDQRDPPDSSWHVVRSYDAFIKFIIDNGVPDVISFDHDLAFEHYPFAEQNPTQTIPYDRYTEKTGYHAAKWLIDFIRGSIYEGEKPRHIIIHTLNIIGRQNIQHLFSKEHVHLIIAPYPLNNKFK